MAYLVRRLLENTSNESFLHLTFDKHTEKDRLLENPAITSTASKNKSPHKVTATYLITCFPTVTYVSESSAQPA